MRVLEVIPARRWRNSTTGQAASLYGAQPWTSLADKANWSVETSGWTWRNDNGTIGLGRMPANTYDEAVIVMNKINNR